jgi:hypothetical protein
MTMDYDLLGLELDCMEMESTASITGYVASVTYKLLPLLNVT